MLADTAIGLRSYDQTISPSDELSFPIERQATSQQVAEALRRQLLSGALAPGTALRDQDVAQRAGVSRPTVREAFAELARDGLLRHQLHRGMIVAQPSPEDIRDIFALRRVLERAGLSRLRTDPGGFVALDEPLAGFARAAAEADGLGLIEADAAFHQAIIDRLGVARLSEAGRRALRELQLVLGVVDQGVTPSELLDEHQSLVHELRDGDARTASRALDRHLAQAEQRVLAI